MFPRINMRTWCSRWRLSRNKESFELVGAPVYELRQAGAMRGMFSPATSVRAPQGDSRAGRGKAGKVQYAAAPRLSPYTVATGAHLLAIEIAARASHVLPNCDFWEAMRMLTSANMLIALMVLADGVEQTL